MGLTLFARLSVILVVLFALSVYIYKLYRVSTRIGKSIIVKLVMGFLLMPIHPIIQLLDLSPLWLYISAIAAQHYGALFLYLGVKQTRDDKVFLQSYRDPMFWIVTVGTIATMSFAFISRENLGSFSENVPHQPTTVYYSYYFLNYVTLFIISTCIIGVYLSEPWIYGDIVYTIRRIPTLVSAVVISIAFFSITTNVVYEAYIGNHIPWLNWVYHVGKGLFALIILLGLPVILMPRKRLLALSRPVQGYLARRKEKHQELIGYLHEKITEVVPGVRLYYNQQHLEDLLTEIADARLIIWTHIKHFWWLSARREADVLYRLTNQGTVIKDPGNYNLPRFPRNEMRYNLAVARYLKRKETR